MPRFPRLVPILLLLLLAACAPAEEVATPTSTAAPSATATATTDWFPATATPSALPPAEGSPTPDMHPGLGEILLEDDFSDPDAWETGADDDGSASVENGQLHLSLRARREYLISRRIEPSFGDFYAEISAQTHICRGDDQYGFVVRAATSASHLRLVLSCDGRARVDRLYSGSFSNVIAWQSNPALPSLAPGSVRLGVWADGQEVRFFANDVFLFSVTDRQLYNGLMGAFIYTSSDADVSVSFSDLTVWVLDE